MYLVLITMRYYIMYPVFALATHSDVFAFSYSGREFAIYQIKRSPSIFWVRLRSEFRECFSIPPLSFSAIYQVGLAHSKAINKLLQRMLRDRHGQWNIRKQPWLWEADHSSSWPPTVIMCTFIYIPDAMDYWPDRSMGEKRSSSSTTELSINEDKSSGVVKSQSPLRTPLYWSYLSWWSMVKERWISPTSHLATICK